MKTEPKKCLRMFLAGTVLFGGALTASLLVGVLPASASGLQVTDCSGSPTDTGSLSYTVAHASAEDTITFLPGLSCPPSSPILLTSTIDIGQNVTITGPGASAMAVSGGGTTSVFSIGAGTTVSISALTIEDGYSASFGGGIYSQGTLTVANSALSGSNAAYGPYIAEGGGAIYNSQAGTLTIEDSTISNNIAELGGGIFNSGTAAITHSLLSNNKSAIGGGGVHNVGTLTATDTIFNNNYGGGYGGGAIANGAGCSSPCATLTVTGSTFSANNSGSGGAAIANAGTASIQNSTFWNNVSAQYGGALGNGGTEEMSSSTVVGSSAYGGGGIANSGSFVVQTSILADSTSGGDCLGNITDGGYNLDDDGSCGFSGTSLSDTAAELDPNGLQDNGGPTPTVALATGSLAIGAVDSASLCSTPDQRGVIRPIPCDIGAFQTGLIGQVITFASAPPSPAFVTGPTYSVSATSTSDLPVGLTIDGLSSSVCSISNGMVSFTAAGTCVIDANQTGDADYAAAPQVQQMISVSRGTPTISWSTPAPIIYGAPLSATQLDATASIPGSFSYSPPLGQVLQAGSQTLSVTFTPTDTADYTSTTSSVTLLVNQTTPDAPTIGTTTRGNASASVAFTPPVSDGGSTITVFSAHCVPLGSGASGSANGSASPIVVSGLTNGDMYTCSVTATNAIGTSVPSAASNTFVPATVPIAPTAPSAVAGNGKATVSWTAPSGDGGSAISGYVVTPYLVGVAQSPHTFNSTATTESVTGLTNAKSYVFKIAAKNAVGTGPQSVASLPILVGLPIAPTGVSANGGFALGKAEVQWTAPTNNGGSSITGYVVTPYTGGIAQPQRVFASPQNFEVITGLTNGTKYTFKVAAINANGTGPQSLPDTPISVGTPAVTSAPLLPSASPGNGQVTLTWSAPTNNGSANVTGYIVTPYVAGVAQPIRVFNANTTQVVTGLTNGQVYTFKIAAGSAAGTSPQSVATSPVTVGTPTAPTGVGATAGVASATVHWLAPTTNNGSAVSGYVITPYLGSVAQPAKTFGSAASTEIVTGLTPSKTYTFKIAAKNARGTGPPSVATNAVTPT